ncbi:DUF4149 domain-containing protein [Amantichitinum ursilacus]|uniref:TMEM205-like domain-containing protein n=1 Tax=Amantichitinum ursilacus TaxID=857265 RepID=A0A0N0GQJ9_9NEIS|nr:DUF4149 domain-containing protein [Amantichitinum ursilacus]KPC54531.1 hypothetical protein WG78_03115 [Amantichitinum ursilacus]
MGNGLKNILTVLWIGGMWIIGLAVTPVLFATLDRASAGLAAGKIFHLIGWIGIAAGLYLLIYRIWFEGLRAFKTGAFWLLIGMLVCTLINQFAIFPIIAGIKSALSQSAQGVFGGGFANWHAISTGIYMIQSALGLLYVWNMDSK